MSTQFHLANIRSGSKGIQFEEELLYTAQEYTRHGKYVYLKRNVVPKTVTKSGRTIYLEKTGHDLDGGVEVTMEDNEKIMQVIAIEAKSIYDTRLNILEPPKTTIKNGKVVTVSQSSGVKHHQLMNLIELGKRGAIAMVLWKRERSKGVPEVLRINPEYLLSKIGSSIHHENDYDNNNIITVPPYSGIGWDFLKFVSL